MPEDMMRDMMQMTIPAIIMIGLFTFLSIAAYADARKKEREAFYRTEIRKKLIEQWGPDKAAQVIELLKADSGDSDLKQLLDLAGDDRPASPRERREHLILAGLITAGVGGGLLLGLRFVPLDGVWMVGFIPLMVGVAILVHAALFVKSEPSK